MSRENLILQKALTYGMIDLDVIRLEVEKMEKDIYLQKHTKKVWQGKDGKWYTWIPTSEGRWLIKKKTKEELEDAVIKYYKESSPTLESVFNSWIEEKINRNEICRGTYDRYFNDFKRYFSEIKDRTLESITEDELEAHIKDNIVSLGLSAKAYGNMRTITKGIFKYAKKRDYTNISISSFFGDMELSKKAFRKVKKTEQIFTDNETPRLLEWLSEHPSIENLGILLAFQTGIREGELSALKFSDIDGNKLHIQRQEVKYKKGNGKYAHEVVEYTKSDAGDRIITLPDSALDTIKRIREINPSGEYLMMVGYRRVITNNFNWYIYKACDQLGIPKRSMHKIRKTYGTMLIDCGIEDSTIMNQMGHSDITTTRKYYYYSHKDDDAKVKQINEAFKKYDGVINGNPSKSQKIAQ